MRTQAGILVVMAARVGAAGGTSSARRRRERRLRSWWRHEAQSVAAALTAARHHSAGPEVVTRREEQQEGEVHEENDALRSQTTPLPGGAAGSPFGPRAAVGRGSRGRLRGCWCAPPGVLHCWPIPRPRPLMVAPSPYSYSAPWKSRGRRRRRLRRRRSWPSWRRSLLRRDRDEVTRVTRQTWSTLSRVEQFAVLWFLAKDAVGKRRVKRKKKRRRTTRVTRWRRSGFLFCCSS